MKYFLSVGFICKKNDDKIDQSCDPSHLLGSTRRLYPCGCSICDRSKCCSFARLHHVVFSILKLCFLSAKSVILVADDGSEGALAQVNSSHVSAIG